MDEHRAYSLQLAVSASPLSRRCYSAGGRASEAVVPDAKDGFPLLCNHLPNA